MHKLGTQFMALTIFLNLYCLAYRSGQKDMNTFQSKLELTINKNLYELIRCVSCCLFVASKAL